MGKKLAIILSALLIPSALQARQQQGAHPKVDQAKVDDAIQKGC